MTVLLVEDAFVSESESFVDFAVRLSAPASATVTVRYATADREAQAGSDYTALSGSLSFAPGETSKSVRVALLADTRLEQNEAFALNLSAAEGASLGRSQALAFIQDNDAPVGEPVISVADVFVDERTPAAVFVVSLDRPSATPVSVTYSTNDMTAQTGFDYIGASGNLRFNPGQTLLTLPIALLDDQGAERLESFEFRLSSPVNAVAGRSVAVAYIAPDDKPVAPDPVLQFRSLPASEADPWVLFSVELSAASSQAVSVNLATSALTSAAVDNGSPTALSLVFDPGETSHVVRVPMADDTVRESAGLLRLSASQAQGARTPGSGFAALYDNDAPVGQPMISLLDASVDESGALLTVMAVLDRPAAVPVSVILSTASGSAMSEADFAGYATQLVFAPGQTLLSFPLVIFDDQEPEPDESFFIRLENPVSASLGDAEAIVIIGRNDLAASILPTVASPSLMVGESEGVVHAVVQLSAPSDQRTEVDFSLVERSARNGGDYVAPTQRLIFEAGETLITVPVAVVADRIAEPAELAGMSLASPLGLALGSLGDLIIQDDDRPGNAGLIVEDAWANEQEGLAWVPIRLSTASTEVVDVNYRLVGVTAVEDGDFVGAAGSLRFVPGQTVANLAIRLVDDPIPEPDEVLLLQITDATGARPLDSEGVVRIARNDIPAAALPAASVAGFQVGEGDGYGVAVVSLERAATTRASVVLNSVGVSASPGSDFSATSASLVFDPGETLRTLRIPVVDDALPEAPEAFRVALSSAAGMQITSSGATALASIADNDNGATGSLIAFGSLQPDRREGADPGLLRFELVRLGDTGIVASVDWAVASSMADAADFGAATMPAGRVDFAAGERAHLVEFGLAGDLVQEQHESFLVNLSQPRGAALGSIALAGRIQNDDIAARNGAPQLGKDGSFLFDAAYYLWANPTLANVGLGTAAAHYLNTGAAQGKAPNSWFDAAYYSNRWDDLRPLSLDAATLFQHFNLYGVWEGRSPGPKFDAFAGDRYLTDNPDVAGYVDAFVADFLGSRTNGAIAHYIIYGANEQRVAFDSSGAAISLEYLFGF